MNRVLKIVSFVVALVLSPTVLAAPLAVTPKVTLTNPAVQDQDDMCVWVHPKDPAQSTVITSDKSAGKLFVYDLEGALVQTVPVSGKPGNIDSRDGFQLGEKTCSIVAFNERDGSAIHLYAVDPETRQLSRVDDGAITTGLNYGFTLYRSPKSGAMYGITVPDEGEGYVEQYLLEATSSGQISGKRVRRWAIGQAEGCVADDRTGMLYIGEEKVGIWAVDAEPDGDVPGKLLQPVGAHGLVADVEGLCLVYGGGGNAYLLASCQGKSTYYVYRLDDALTFVKTFTVRGATITDGIDIVYQKLGSVFPNGFFALHNGMAAPYPVLLCDIRDLALTLE